MAIKFNSVKCPDCGATLPIEEGRNQMFCSYCGSSIIATNENEYIYRNIDEAKVKQAEAEIKKSEAERAIKLKKLEIIEKKRESVARVKKIKIVVSIILGMVGIISFLVGLEMVGMVSLVIIMYMWLFSMASDKNDDDLDLEDKVKVPSLINDLDDDNINYKELEYAFKSAGFVNIKSIPLNDLTFGILKKPGIVESVKINGKEITSDDDGKKFAHTADIVISYHSFSK